MKTAMRRMAGIYAIICDPTGQRYVGATANLASREQFHMAAIRKGRHGNPKMVALIQQHGPAAFRWAVIERIDGPNLQELLARSEAKWQKEAGDMLVNSPHHRYSRGRPLVSIAHLMQEFRARCLANRLDFRDELEAAFSAHFQSA